MPDDPYVSRPGRWRASLISSLTFFTGIDGCTAIRFGITPRSYTGRLGVIGDTDYWTPTNPTNRNPSPNVGQVERLYATSRLYTDGSHWRVRNITVGYTMSERLAQRLGMKSLRLYGTAQDPYIHTNYLGTDPEVAGAAPTVRTLLLGSNISW